MKRTKRSTLFVLLFNAVIAGLISIISAAMGIYGAFAGEIPNLNTGLAIGAISFGLGLWSALLFLIWRRRHR